MNLEEQLNLPKSFIELRERCIGDFDIKIVQHDDILDEIEQADLSNSAAKMTLSQGWLLQLRMKNRAARFPIFLIGTSPEGYFNTSRVEIIDLKSRKLKTHSESIYGFDELIHSDPPDAHTIDVAYRIGHLTRGMTSKLIELPDFIYLYNRMESPMSAIEVELEEFEEKIALYFEAASNTPPLIITKQNVPELVILPVQQYYDLLAAGRGLKARILRIMSSSSSKHMVFTASDFKSLGKQASIRHTLSDLTNKGLIRRIDRGFYDLPIYNKLLCKNSPPSASAIAEAIARRDEIKLFPCMLTSANILGFTTAVSTENRYSTNGQSITYRVNGWTISFEHIDPELAELKSKCAVLIQALLWHGEPATNHDQIIAKVAKIYTTEDLLEIYNSKVVLPVWVRGLVKQSIHFSSMPQKT